jgi:hypothetical protein
MTRTALTVALGLLLTATSSHAQQPWLRVQAQYDRDTQVRSEQRLVVEHGRFLRPDATLALRLAGGQLTGNMDSPGSNRYRVGSWTGSAGLSATLSVPAARLGLELGGDLLLGAPGAGRAEGVTTHGERNSETVVLSSGRARLGLIERFSLRLSAERGRYTATLASLDTLVMATILEIALDRAAEPGWAGEIVARRAGYGDDNPVNTAFAWLLAPLHRSATQSLRAGYAIGWQDAERSNWAPYGTLSGAVVPREIVGRYSPYYTPEEVLTHILLLNGALATGSAWWSFNGAVGVAASELAPVLILASDESGARPDLWFYRRTFTPFSAELAFARPLGSASALSVAGEYRRTAYYRAGSLRAAVVRSL